MIKCHLNRLMADRRLNVSEVARETGIKRTMIDLMYKNEVQRLDVEALDALCRYFNCAVGDILEYDATLPGNSSGK
jgi:putative transcriptional regulator